MVPFKGTLKGYHDRAPRRRSVARTETFTAFRPLPDLDTWIGIKAFFFFLNAFFRPAVKVG